MINKLKKTLFIVFPFIAFGIIIFPTLITGIYASFTDWNGFDSPYDSSWIGIKNFQEAFLVNDGSFENSIYFTLQISLTLVLLVNILSISLAYLVTRPFKGTMFFKGAYFLPNIIGGIVVGYIWDFIFRTVFAQIGFGDAWLQDSSTGFWGIVIMSIWQQAGYMMVIYIAAIQNIPNDIMEASKIDGSSSFKTFWKIALPYIMPAFTIVTFLVIRFSFGLFDQVLALTGGGPNNETETIALSIYDTMFTYKSGTYLRIGQAQGVIYFAIVVLIVSFQVKLTKRKEYSG